MMGIMKRHGYKGQRGTFSVEFAIVGVAFALILAFCGDVVMKISMKGKLDRMSFSAAGLIKERTALFGEQYYKISQTDFIAQSGQVNSAIQASMGRMLGSFDANRFGIVLEAWNDGGALPTQKYGGVSGKCNTGTALGQNLSVMTSWGRYASLYRVTVCYKTDNWFGDLVGESYEMVQSSSLVIAR